MQHTLPDLQEKLKAWDGCALKKQSNIVLGEGNFEADIIFIGEAPGKKEDELGRPFVGASGKFLDDLIDSIGWCRSQVYISNVVKYRPPENRDPTTEEKNLCMPWLMMEIGIIKPKVIVPLGRHALGNFCTDVSISDVHGIAQKYSDDITIFPLYHPAAALHNGGLRQTLKDDFQKLKNFLDEAGVSPPS
jgi:uracil-DNA glycosylase family 4